MAVLAGLINKSRPQIKADEYDDYKQDLTDAVAYLERIQELLVNAKSVLDQLDEEVQDAFNSNAYIGNGLRVRMGADALKASGIEKAIPAVEKHIKDLKQDLKR